MGSNGSNSSSGSSLNQYNTDVMFKKGVKPDSSMVDAISKKFTEPTPVMTDEEKAAQAWEDERKKMAAMQGFMSTINTSPLLMKTKGPSVKKTLLGQ